MEFLKVDSLPGQSQEAKSERVELRPKPSPLSPSPAPQTALSSGRAFGELERWLRKRRMERAENAPSVSGGESRLHAIQARSEYQARESLLSNLLGGTLKLSSFLDRLMSNLINKIRE